MLSKAEFRGGALALAGVLVLVLLVVSLTPGLPGEMLLQSLRFHLVAVGLGLALLIALLGAPWRALLLLLPVLAAGLHGGMLMWELYARAQKTGTPVARFELLSFNVLTGNRRAEDLVEAILADPPDVALIMETPGVEAYLDQLAGVLPYRVGCADTRSCDISLHSRFPIEDGRVLNLPPFGNERLVLGRVVVDGQAVTIAGTHLSKPYFDGASWTELAYIDRVLRPIAGPMVLAGDFNAAPWTEPLAMLTNRLALSPGPWPAATWPVRLGALGVPIDNVFSRGSARLLTLEAGDSHGSNHRPLRAEVGVYAE